MKGYCCQRDYSYNVGAYSSNTFQNFPFYSQQRISREVWNTNRSAGLSSLYDRANFSPERSRQRDRQLPASVNNNYNDRLGPKDSWERGRCRGRGHQSLSVPRGFPGCDLNKSRQVGYWRNSDDSSRQGLFDFEHQCVRDEAISPNISPDNKCANKFRSIFKPPTDSVAGTEPTMFRITREHTKEETEEHLINIIDKIEMPTFSNDKDVSDSVKKDDVSRYYGESITRIDESSTLRVALPVVDWPKNTNARSLNQIPVYDSDTCVGGDGVTLEVFYLCKYCKMFSGGAEVKNHLKSRYHYDRYRAYLETGVLLSSSSDSSSSDESEPSQEKASASANQGEVNNNNNLLTNTSPYVSNKNYISDTDDIDFYWDEQLDFD